MKSILTKQINDLLCEVRNALTIVQQIDPAPELYQYKYWLDSAYQSILNRLLKLESFLKLNDSTIYPDIYSTIATLQRNFRVVNARFLPALYRHQVQDRVVLHLLAWLHDQHYQTRDKAFAVQDDDFSIYPTTQYPLIYFLPITSQHTLLHTPLFFHEIGHYFYEFHKIRMTEITKNLQRRLESYLVVAIQQNDERSKAEKKRNDLIVETWFDWLCEFFCDAVGLHIGGPAYLFSFSSYLLQYGSSSFFIPETDLAKSKHPVTWIRIKLLIELAKVWDLKNEATLVENEWNTIARDIKIKENHFGYFTETYIGDIKQSIEEMLEVVKPISFKDYDYDSGKIQTNNYVQLVNTAWSQYYSNPDTYFKWEKEILTNLRRDVAISRLAA